MATQPKTPADVALSIRHLKDSVRYNQSHARDHERAGMKAQQQLQRLQTKQPLSRMKAAGSGQAPATGRMKTPGIPFATRGMTHEADNIIRQADVYAAHNNPRMDFPPHPVPGAGRPHFSAPSKRSKLTPQMGRLR